MCHARTKSVDKLVEHEFAFKQILDIFANFASQTIEELGLHLSQRLSRLATTSCQTWIGLLPLHQFALPLPMVGAYLIYEFLKQFVLLVLSGHQLPQYCRNFSVLGA